MGSYNLLKDRKLKNDKAFISKKKKGKKIHWFNKTPIKIPKPVFEQLDELLFCCILKNKEPIMGKIFLKR